MSHAIIVIGTSPGTSTPRSNSSATCARTSAVQSA